MLDFIKKDIWPFPEAETEEFESCLDFFVILFLEVFSVQWIFEVEEELVVSLETVSDKGEGGGLAGSSHAGQHNCLRGIKISLYVIVYRPRVNHGYSLHKVELFVN